MRYEELRGKIKKNDFVELRTKFQNNLNKCVILFMSKDLIKIAMILEDGDTAAVSPVMAITYDVLSAVNKIDGHKLLFYSDLNNVHINKAIMSKNNNKRSNAKI
jgi:hypothetical protein